MASQAQTVTDGARAMLRHVIATIAYRGGKTMRGAPENFGSFRASEKTRTPAEIVAHLGDLMDWALSMARGKQEWHDTQAGAEWAAGVARFHRSLEALDEYLGSNEPLGAPAEKLFQGPLADALTHVGQLAMLRRMAGGPVKGENYFKAEIVAGRVGAEQSQAVREFD